MTDRVKMIGCSSPGDRFRRLRKQLTVWMLLSIAPALGFMIAFWFLANGVPDWYGATLAGVVAGISTLIWIVCVYHVRDLLVELVGIMLELNAMGANSSDRDERFD